MLWFSARKQLDDIFNEWVKKENLSNCSFNVISFLVGKNLLDEAKVIEFLKEPKHLPDVGKLSEPTDNTKIEKLVVDETDINCLGIHSKTILLNIIDRLNKVINKVNIHSTVLLAQEKDIKEIQEELDY